MTKLPKQTLQNIELSQVKKLLQENNGISNCKEYIRSNISEILKQENKKQLSKENFELLEKSQEADKLYFELLEKLGLDISYELLNYLKKLMQGKNIEQFETLLNNANISRVLNFSKEQNLKYLIDICKSPEQFESLCDNENIRHVLNFSKEQNFKYFIDLHKTPEQLESFFSYKKNLNLNLINLLEYGQHHNIKYVIELYNIQTPEQFKSLCDNENIRNVLIYSKEQNLKYVIELYNIQTPKQFETLCDNGNIRSVLQYSKEQNLKCLIDICKSPEQFKSLCDNGNIRNVLNSSKEQNLKYVVDLYNIKSPEQFESLCDNEDIRDILIYSQEQNLKYVVELYNIQTPEQFESLCDNVYIKYNLHYCGHLSEFLSIIDDKKIQIDIIENFHNDKITELSEKIEKIKACKLGINFGFFVECLKAGIDLEKIDFPIKKENFLDFVDDNDIIFDFEKDCGTKFDGIKPWSKAWFLENPDRKNYLTPEKVEAFEKFGTIIGLGVIEGSHNSQSIKSFYENIFENISFEKNRSSILQLGEVFNLILKQEKYKIFDEILPNSNIGQEFKDFIEKNNISNKGRTILTLLITREIKDSFQIFKNPQGNEEVDFSSIETLFKRVGEKLRLYKTEIDKYKNLPIKTSIGMEYEVTTSIARGYEETVGSDYKNDIEIISEYAEVAKGNDAVHEIATSPTDNPMLLILEMKLLEDLDFIDLNFKKEDYARGSRSLHITLGGEYGISLNRESNFIQNILIAGNLGGVNAGEEIDRVNRYFNLREKGSDCKALFSRNKTDTLEYRGLSIDKKEQFERMILSIFNLNMAKQVVEKYVNLSFLHNDVDLFSMLDNFEIFKKLLNNKLIVKEKIEDERICALIYNFFKLQKDVIDLIMNHNNNFITQESLDLENDTGIEKLLLSSTSTSPFAVLCERIGLSIYYFKTLEDYKFSNEEEFFEKLKSDGKNIDSLTQRQKTIIYKGYKTIIRKNLLKVKSDDLNKYENIGDYLNGNTANTVRRITNSKRWKEVIGEDQRYLSSLQINPISFFDDISPELINKFTRINNLFIKKDSTNSLAMYDNTLESDGTLISDRRLAETTIFDKLDTGLKPRSGYNIIQGASEKMLTQAIQKMILEFNDEINKSL